MGDYIPPEELAKLLAKGGDKVRGREGMLDLDLLQGARLWAGARPRTRARKGCWLRGGPPWHPLSHFPCFMVCCLGSAGRR